MHRPVFGWMDRQRMHARTYVRTRRPIDPRPERFMAIINSWWVQYKRSTRTVYVLLLVRGLG